jgi:hypothetical protein
MTIYPAHIRRATVEIARIIEATPPPRCFDLIAARIVDLLREERATAESRVFVLKPVGDD